MRKRRVIILAVSVLAVLALMAGVTWRAVTAGPPDPVYQGRHLSYWLSPNAFTGNNFANQELAFIHTMLDAKALPYLEHTLHRREGPLRATFQRLWVNHFPAWLKARVSYPESASTYRGVACVFLQGMEATARPAIPELIRTLQQDESDGVRFSAGYALMDIASPDDQRVIEALVVAATKDTNSNVRADAGAALIRLNPEAAAKAGVKSL